MILPPTTCVTTPLVLWPVGILRRRPISSRGGILHRRTLAPTHSSPNVVCVVVTESGRVAPHQAILDIMTARLRK
jgi:hypothetical protein